MLKLGRVTKFKMLFLVLVFVINFDIFKFSAAILEKGLFRPCVPDMQPIYKCSRYIQTHSDIGVTEQITFLC